VEFTIREDGAIRFSSWYVTAGVGMVQRGEVGLYTLLVCKIDAEG
jgi:hypothetical protein